ncbi:MAG: hypothetical protein AAFW98_10265 [Pseudomonadota bacterium]
MSQGLGDLTFFRDPDLDKLAAVVFDLSAQLHVERHRRMALEAALIADGSISREKIDALADDEAFMGEARAALDASQARLFAILKERGDRRTPLRAETRSVPRTV